MGSFSNRGIAVVNELAEEGITAAVEEEWTPEAIGLLEIAIRGHERELSRLRELYRRAVGLRLARN